MKRRTSNMIASVLSVSALGIPTLPIFAQAVVQETTIIEVNTVQDFLNQYLSTKSEWIDVNGVVNVTYTPITFVDETNYEIVLFAKNFYDSLSANVIFIVDGQYYVPKTQEQINKDLALKDEIDAFFALNNNYFFGLVNDAIVKNQEILTAQELARQQEELLKQMEEEKEEAAKKEISFVTDSKENTPKVDVESSESKETTEAEEILEEVDIDKKEVVKVSEGATLAIEAGNSNSLLEMAKPVVEEVVEETIEMESANTLAVPLVEEVEMNVEVEQPVIALVEEPELTLEQAAAIVVDTPTILMENSPSKAAQDFVNTYLTSSQGIIFAQANQVNFQTILNSLSAWNNLSQGDKDQVNSILQNKVGKTYQTLLQEAQTIKTGGTLPYNPGVHTGVNTNAGLYAAMCGLSAAVFGFITRKKEI